PPLRPGTLGRDHDRHLDHERGAERDHGPGDEAVHAHGEGHGPAVREGSRRPQGGRRVLTHSRLRLRRYGRTTSSANRSVPHGGDDLAEGSFDKVAGPAVELVMALLQAL